MRLRQAMKILNNGGPKRRRYPIVTLENALRRVGAFEDYFRHRVPMIRLSRRIKEQSRILSDVMAKFG